MSFTKGFLKVAKDILPGGLADNKPASEFDPKQLAKGKKVEREHTDNEDIIEEIEKDHLEEDPKYYTHLSEMEKKYKK